MKNKKWILRGIGYGVLIWLMSELANYYFEGGLPRWYLLVFIIPIWLGISYYHSRKEQRANEK